MTTKNAVITTSIPVARRFIVWSWRLRSSSRRTGGVDDPAPGTLLIPDVAGESESETDAVVRTSTAIADGSDDPDLLIPGSRSVHAAGSVHACRATGRKGHRKVLDAVDEAGQEAGGLA